MAAMNAAQRVLRMALEQVYAGDQSAEAGCVLDAITDAGYALVSRPEVAVDTERVREAPRGRVPDTGRLRG